MPTLVSDAEFDTLLLRTQGAARERMLREMTEPLEAIALETPVILVLEDLHWGDHATLDLLGRVARQQRGVRLLLLGTYRPAEVIITTLRYGWLCKSYRVTRSVRN
jgi:predicted ATPase